MPTKSFGYEYAKLAAVSGVCAVCLGAVGYFPTRALTTGHGLTAMALGIGVSLLAGLVGAIPFCMALGQARAKVPVAVLAGTALRLCLVLAAVIPITFSGLVHRKSFVVWVAVSYLVLLFADTLVAVMRLKAAREDRS